MRILLVEDSEELAQHVARALERAGHECTLAGDGPRALVESLATSFDVVVLDVNLPGFDGFTVLRRMRDAGVSARVIMLTARSAINDRVTGLRAGADDYLTKPFALEELLARVEALGRRVGTPGEEDGSLLVAGDVRMDVKTRRVTRGGERVELSPREFEVLQIFMSELGRTFSRDEICERIWEREHEYDTRTVEIFIMRLRKKLDPGRNGNLIETVRGVGYVMRGT